MVQHPSASFLTRLRPHLLVALYCVIATFIVKPIAGYIDLANVVILFLLLVFLVARKYGRGPALTASFLAVGLFDFFFVPPHLSFAVDDIQYLITFLVMLTVAIITGQLVARLGQQAIEATERERRNHALYKMASRLAGAMTLNQVEEIAHGFLWEASHVSASLLVPDSKDKLHYLDAALASTINAALPERAYHEGEPVDQVGLTGQGTRRLYMPLKAPMRIRGVMEVSAENDTLEQERELLTTVSNLVAIAIERIHYADVAQATGIQMASERLRNSVLASLSHDLRTPLTAMVGLAETLTRAGEALPPLHQDTANALHQQAVELSVMVNNLLELARISSGSLRLRKEWQPLEEVIGAAIKRLGPALASHPVQVALPPDLPLLEFDAVLLERVIGNLLDNACKHAPEGTSIRVSANTLGNRAQISICDQGPGFAADIDLEAPFLREAADSGKPSVGLGLTICKAIVEAHQGRLTLSAPKDGQGTCVQFTLPLGTPPIIEEEMPEMGS